MIKKMLLLSSLIFSLLISCSVQAPPPPYYTLTLDIKGEKPQVLYYGKETEKWYKKLSKEGLLVDENVIEGDNIKFYIKDNKDVKEKRWVVSFDKNLPQGVDSKDFMFVGTYNSSTFSTNIDRLEFYHYPTLYIPNNSYFDIEGDRKGIINVKSIDRSTTIHGYYEPINQTFTVAVGDNNKISIGWRLNSKSGELLDFDSNVGWSFTINDNTTLYAKW